LLEKKIKANSQILKKKMSKFLWIFLACVTLVVLCTPHKHPPAQVQTSNIVMVVVKTPSVALLDDLRVPGVSVVSRLKPELVRERFELGQLIRTSTTGYEPYTLMIDGNCRLVKDWLRILLSCLAVAHTHGFSAVTQMPSSRGPTFPHMEQSGYRARVFVFPGRPYQSEVVSKRFLFGTSAIMKPFLKHKSSREGSREGLRKDLTLFASENYTRICNAVQWVVTGPDETERFGIARDVKGLEKTDKFGNIKS
jgi:hypothetical protein